jgi:hypothetical protein
MGMTGILARFGIIGQGGMGRLGLVRVHDSGEFARQMPLAYAWSRKEEMPAVINPSGSANSLMASPTG